MISTGRNQTGAFFQSGFLGMVNIMKKSILATLLGAFALATLPLASAQTMPAAQDDTVTIPAPSAIAAPGPGRYMDPVEFGHYKGGYSLSNGQTLMLTRRGTRMYAEIEDQGAHQIVVTAPDTFVALDRQLQVRFEFDSLGDVGGEVLMMVPSRGVAGESAAPAQLVRMAIR
jgi:hypothetical protein